MNEVMYLILLGGIAIAAIWDWVIAQLFPSPHSIKEEPVEKVDTKRVKGGLKRVEKGMFDPIKELYENGVNFYNSAKGYQGRLVLG
jgi:hypothetical protein